MINYLSKNEKLDEQLTNGITVVDFFANWCGPCKMLSPVLDSLSQDNINVIKVDVDQFEKLARSFGIMSIPTIQIYKDKELKQQLTGYMTKNELLEVIEKIS